MIRETIKLILSEFVLGVIYISVYFGVYPIFDALANVPTDSAVTFLIFQAEKIMNIFFIILFLIPVIWYFLRAHKKEYEYEILKV